MTDSLRSRRAFVAGSAAGIGTTWVLAHWPAIVAAHDHAPASVDDPRPVSLEFFTTEEAAVIDAIAAQIVPTDETPGSREAGALFFIDRSMRTWAAAKADAFRGGLKEFQDRFAAVHPGRAFPTVDSATQSAFLTQVEATDFFKQVRFLTLLGMFVRPAYGGNRSGVGWQLIGFDDAHAFFPPFGYYDRDYPGFVASKDSP